MTDDRVAPRSLLDRPQPLGILPTQWFWRQEHAPVIRWGFALLAGVTVLVTVALTDSVIVAGLVPPLVLLLANGLLEKYVRQQVAKRRVELAERTAEALPDADSRRCE